LCFEWAEEKKLELLESLLYCKSLGFTQFHIQFEDLYSYEVNQNQYQYQYQTFDQCYDWISQNCNIDRKQIWGMIHCN
jgi:hypothetical protein